MTLSKGNATAAIRAITPQNQCQNRYISVISGLLFVTNLYCVVRRWSTLAVGWSLWSGLVLLCWSKEEKGKVERLVFHFWPQMFVGRSYMKEVMIWNLYLATTRSTGQ